MTRTMTPAQFKATATAKPSKYRNKRTEVDGITFDSKLEAEWWVRLRETYGRENVIRQVSLPLGDNGTRFKIDFMVITARPDTGTPGDLNGNIAVKFFDAKGRETDAARIKRDWLWTQHKIELRYLTRKDLKR